MFYWFHRLMHTHYFYKTFHKFHHRYHRPVPLSVEYFHPLEFVFANSVLIFLGPILLNCHITTFWIWLVLRIWEGVDGHCGYDFGLSRLGIFPFALGQMYTTTTTHIMWVITDLSSSFGTGYVAPTCPSQTIKQGWRGTRKRFLRNGHQEIT